MADCTHCQRPRALCIALSWAPIAAGVAVTALTPLAALAVLR